MPLLQDRVWDDCTCQCRQYREGKHTQGEQQHAEQVTGHEAGCSKLLLVSETNKNHQQEILFSWPELEHTIRQYSLS
jgi:hypothetical protein